jgi:Trypsin-co-occurring domain 1
MHRIIRETLHKEGEDFEIQIEVDEVSPRALERREDYGSMRGDRVPLVERPFEKGMELIRACAEQVSATIHRVSEAARPSEIEVELGIKFDSEVGALISRTGVEAHLQVTLKWSRRQSE